MVEESGQEELNLEELALVSADAAWFHVFRSMIDNGDAAKMGAYAFMVYSVIKSHANFNTGRAFPSVETIMKKSGISRAQVMRCLITLEKMDYLTKMKEGRKNLYVLREKVGITDERGRPSGVATWDYLPKGVQEAVAELRNVLVTGDFQGAKIINIQNLHLNINNAYEGSQNIIAQNYFESEFTKSLEGLPEGLKKTVIENFRKNHGKQTQ